MKRPNILIFMTDHQRADTVLPEHPAVTPNLTQFVQDGITFTETYCPTAHCCPARATFMTGLYPSRSGVWNNICNEQALSHGLNEGVRLWSEDLADAGYNLAWSGKWHVSIYESPADRGWGELFASATAGAHHGPSWENYQRIAAQPEKTERGEGEILRPGYGTYRLYGTAFEENRHDRRAVDEALAILPELARDGRPWALYVGTIAPHDPYVVPQKYLDLYSTDDVPLPASFADEMRNRPRVYQRMREQIWGQLTEREVREGIRHFWAYCTYLDDLFGQLLAALDETGQADDTLVVYCSDHGDYCGEHGLFAKGVPAFRGAYNVPAVVRWPNGIVRPGRRVNHFVSLADFAPTFAELAGVKVSRDFSGRSLVPLLCDQVPPDWRDAIFTQLNGVELYYTQRSLMTKDFKYVFNGFDFDELYDLRTDPNEMRNLADDPAYEAVKRDMAARMWRFAYQEKDTAINSYITVGLAPYGPAEAFRDR